MKKQTLTFTIIGFLILGLVLVGNINATGAFAATEIQDATLSTLWGGAVYSCETGCETKSDHCGAYKKDCVPAQNYDGCVRCTADSQKEACEDWGTCMTWPTNTCQDCVPDVPHDCGRQQLGVCETGTGCVIVKEDDGPCGSVTQCHTVNR